MSDFDYVFSSPISTCELVFLILSSIFHTKAEIQSLLVVWLSQIYGMSVAWASNIGHASTNLIPVSVFFRPQARYSI